jgi:hypothetical protein
MLELSSFKQSFILEMVKSIVKTKSKFIYYMQKLSFHGIAQLYNLNMHTVCYVLMFTL